VLHRACTHASSGPVNWAARACRENLWHDPVAACLPRCPMSEWSWLAGWPQAVLDETALPSALDEVKAMRRYLLVLDMALPARNENLYLEPINYRAARQDQERGEVVVLSVVANRQVKLSPMELLLGAASAHPASAPSKYPTAPQPGHPVNAAAEHRMHLAVRHLKTIGYQASGLMSDEELVKAVGSETRRHHYDEVILAA